MTPVAIKAAECVKTMLNKDEKTKEKYLSRVTGLGSMIVQNGLAGTVLFVKIKGPEEVIQHLNELIEVQTGQKDFCNLIIEGKNISQHEYIKAQFAVMEGVKWLRRYAEIFLKEE